MIPESIVLDNLNKKTTPSEIPNKNTPNQQMPWA